jgi:CRP-like cAMP-binding protein
MEPVKDPAAPDAPVVPVEEHADEAQWALTTARTLQDRGDTEGAVSWYRRAVEHLMDSGNDEAALEVARLAAALSSAPPPSARSSAIPSSLSSSPPRVTTQPSQVPATFLAMRDAPPLLIESDDPSTSGEINTRLSSELLVALRRAVSFQPMRAAEGEHLAARLSHAPLFRGMPGETLRAVARQSSVVRFEQGDAILMPAHSGHEPPLYVLLEGRGLLRANGDEGPGAPLGPGDFVGEVAALYGGPGVMTATARSPVTAAALPRSLVCWLAREIPDVRVMLEDCAWERSFGAIGRAAPFLRRLPPDQRGVAYARFEPVLLNAGDLMLGEGAPPLAFWILAAGEVEVYGGGINGRQPIRARAGDAIGLRAILEGEPSGVTARTLGTVLAAKVGINGFRLLVEKHPSLADALDDVGLPGRAILC